MVQSTIFRPRSVELTVSTHPFQSSRKVETPGLIFACADRSSRCMPRRSGSRSRGRSRMSGSVLGRHHLQVEKCFLLNAGRCRWKTLFKTCYIERITYSFPKFPKHRNSGPDLCPELCHVVAAHAHEETIECCTVFRRIVTNLQIQKKKHRYFLCILTAPVYAQKMNQWTCHFILPKPVPSK